MPQQSTPAATPLSEELHAVMLQRERLQLKLTEAAIDFYGSLGMLDARDIDIDGDGWGVAGVKPYGRLSQKRGEVLPVYTTEQELKAIRDRTRKIQAENGFAICATENRQSYVVGEGLIHRAVAKRPDTPPELVQRCQNVIDAFGELNELPEVESESIERLDKDGEAIYRFFPRKNGLLAMRVVEPEHLRSPVGSGYGAHYSFGVQTDEDDVENIQGYWVVEDPLRKGTTPTFVPPDEILHIKANTPKNAKRGLPIWYPVEDNLRRAEEILASVGSMAKTRAKIAMIRQFSGSLQSTANNLVQSNVAATVTDPYNSQSINLERLRYGTVLNSSKNIDYLFPSADVDAGSFIAILQAELRAIAARLVMPEWMLSVDASNANFSSSLIAEAPSTKRFLRLQKQLSRAFGESRKAVRLSAVWRQLRHAIALGILPRDLAKWVKIQTEAPSLVVRDKSAEATANKSYFDMRIKSPQTIQGELGLDSKQEAANFKALGIDPKPGGQQPPAGGNPPGGLGDGLGGPPANPEPPGLAGLPAPVTEGWNPNDHPRAQDGKFGSGSSSGGSSDRDKEAAEALDVKHAEEAQDLEWRQIEEVDELSDKHNAQIEALHAQHAKQREKADYDNLDDTSEIDDAQQAEMDALVEKQEAEMDKLRSRHSRQEERLSDRHNDEQERRQTLLDRHAGQRDKLEAKHEKELEKLRDKHEAAEEAAAESDDYDAVVAANQAELDRLEAKQAKEADRLAGNHRAELHKQAGTKPVTEAVEPNKTGSGCHDSETGHPAPCPGGDQAQAGAKTGQVDTSKPHFLGNKKNPDLILVMPGAGKDGKNKEIWKDSSEYIPASVDMATSTMQGTLDTAVDRLQGYLDNGTIPAGFDADVAAEKMSAHLGGLIDGAAKRIVQTMAYQHRYSPDAFNRLDTSSLDSLADQAKADVSELVQSILGTIADADVDDIDSLSEAEQQLQDLHQEISDRLGELASDLKDKAQQFADDVAYMHEKAAEQDEAEAADLAGQLNDYDDPQDATDDAASYNADLAAAGSPWRLWLDPESNDWGYTDQDDLRDSDIDWPGKAEEDAAAKKKASESVSYGRLRVLGIDGRRGQFLREAGFTGEKTDKLGRKVRYVNGVRVKGQQQAAASKAQAGHASVLGPATKQLSALAAHGKNAFAKGGKGVAAVKALASAGFDRLPAAVKGPVTGFVKLAYVGYVAGNKAVQAVAKAKGMTDEQASALAKLTTTADMALGGTRAAAVMSAIGLPHLAPAAAMLPIGSLGYLAYSTARDPMATLKAAKTAVAGVAAKFKRKAAEAVEGKVLELLADRLLAAGDKADWYQALVYAALDSAGSLAKAIAIADQAMAAK